MWERLLPKFVGGTMTDLDGPPDPEATTRIVSAEIERRNDQEFVTLHGEGFDWSCARKYCGVSGEGPDGTLDLFGIMGMRCHIVPPAPPGERTP